MNHNRNNQFPFQSTMHCQILDQMETLRSRMEITVLNIVCMQNNPEGTFEEEKLVFSSFANNSINFFFWGTYKQVIWIVISFTKILTFLYWTMF